MDEFKMVFFEAGGFRVAQDDGCRMISVVPDDVSDSEFG